MMGRVDDWLLLLGAGASIAPPTSIPAFDSLARGIFTALGWESYVERRGGDEHAADTGEFRWRRAGVPGFPTISTPRGKFPPEVLFGTLHLFGVAFEGNLRRALGGLEPNVAHYVAAAVIRAGGAVWTPNVDLAVEEAHRRAYGSMPHRACRVPSGPADASDDVAPLAGATGRSLVKFHGSLDVAGSLAFTDRQLLVPPEPEDVEHLLASVAGRRVVVLGYAGMDADLSPMFARAMGAASDVVWFEPSTSARAAIGRAYGSGIVFQPEPVDPWPLCFPQTLAGFLDLADAHGLTGDVPGDVRDEYLGSEGVEAAPPVFSFVPAPSAVVHAWLVQRFGDPDGEAVALRAAAAEDVAQIAALVGETRSYVRWALSRSVYGGGWAAHVVSAAAGLARRGRTPSVPGLRAARDAVLTRQCALLLRAGRWSELESLADDAVALGRGPGGEAHPSDLYYRAHARRYRFRVGDAVRDSAAAQTGLAKIGDPERLAGAVLESGILALYQGRPLDALDLANDLEDRRGGYAIQRWRAWGGWLAASALNVVGDTDAAREALDRSSSRFRAETQPGPLMDCATARLVADRVDLALGRRVADPVVPADFELVSKRQQDDVCLVLADLAVARGDVAAADRLIGRVEESPSCEVARLWARFGRNELDRLAGGATDFASIADTAAEAGGTWLQAHATVAARMTEPPAHPASDVPDPFDLVPQVLDPGRRAARDLHLNPVGPRVLWLQN